MGLGHRIVGAAILGNEDNPDYLEVIWLNAKQVASLVEVSQPCESIDSEILKDGGFQVVRTRPLPRFERFYTGS